MEKEWVMATLEHLAEFGASERGITRLAFDTAERQAREYIEEEMRQAGLSVRRDAFGNVIGRMEGAESGAPAVVTGSHLDTVPEGGKYDGAVGVVGALSAIRQLKAAGPLTHPLEMIIFAAEESSRFGYGTMGSKAMIGMANIAAWSKAQDQAGVLFPAALAAQDIDLNKVKEAARQGEEIKAFVELHIEQGPVLERAEINIGVVEAIAAPTRLRITVEGTPAHSGTTPMEDRQDALVSAAMIILAVQEIALDESYRGTVGTVGIVKVLPNVMNVVPGWVEMGVDIRGVDHESIIDTIQEIKDAVSTIADGQETPVSIVVLTSDKPVPLHPEIVDTVEAASRSLNLSCRRMNSGAGHDAMNMAHIAPAGMIFIPCRAGISHNPDEYAAPDDIMNGIAVLSETLRQLAR